MDRSHSDAENVSSVDMLTIAQFSDLCVAMPSAEATDKPRAARYTKSMEIHAEAVNRLPRYLLEWIEANEDAVLAKSQPFQFVIPHQSALKIITSVSEEMFDYVMSIEKFKNVEMPEVLTYIQDFGNTSSTSHFVVLYHALKDKKVKPGDSILLIPHASGIVAGFLWLKLGNLEV
jgi:3-oxoacyl-[acyl-carrier-protein] synthase-3